MSPIDEGAFRDVASHFATGVTIITSMTPDGPVGFTCQSFHSLSLEPTLVAFAARGDSVSWPRIRHEGVVGINVLSDAQEELARRFARTATDKFDAVNWSPGRSGVPLLEGALAHLEGRIDQVLSIGDHELAVTEVTAAVAGTGAPLLYFRRGFGTFTR